MQTSQLVVNRAHGCIDAGEDIETGKPRRAPDHAHPRPTDRDAPLGPRRSGNGQAHTVDPARDGPAGPGHPSRLNSRACWAAVEVAVGSA